MRTAFIVHDCNNDSLLRFTQTKLLFDAKNKGVDFFKNIVTVSTYAMAEEQYSHGDVILETGDFLTSKFRKSVIPKYSRDSEHVIKFDKNIPIDFKGRYYAPGSKQLYIIENLLKVCINSKKLVYLDNNESPISNYYNAKHLYGLASGWKTARYALSGNFDTITVYDYNERQLEFSKYLHSNSTLPKEVDVRSPTSGEYNPPIDMIDNWHIWHKMPVKFEVINLFDLPVFPENSLVWISNVFRYEPTIFIYGYEKTVDAKNRLQEMNKNSIIVK